MKVLIIGAGPTGLSAALDLAQRGIVPDVVEKRTGPSDLSRAVGIIPATRSHLERSGASAAILRESMAFRKFSLYRGHKRLLNIDFSTTLKPEEVMIGLPQNRTETLIREAGEQFGLKVQYGIEASEVETNETEAMATFSDGRKERYDWIIGADGKDSTTRGQLGISYPGIDLSETWSIADVDIGSGYDPEQVSAWIQGEDGLFVLILPIEQKRLRIVSSTPDCLKSLPLTLDIRSVRRTGTFNISIRQAETYRKGRVLLAGDAAHCHSPVGGKGMNLGIDDGFAAVAAIANGSTSQYTAERHRIGAAVLRSSENARKMITSNDVWQRTLVTVFCKMASHSHWFQKALLRRIATL